MEVPMIIGGKEVRNDNLADISRYVSYPRIVGETGGKDFIFAHSSCDVEALVAAVVAQQPFGGTRASGTNDKAGSWLNLERWVSPRAIKETFVPPRDFRHPYMAKE
jgi:acyl-CoA reductase-like NAD-dependent aldehyde dehydrogenase